VQIFGKPQRTIWREDDAVGIIDQTELPHAFVTRRITTLAEMVEAIAMMRVRGAPLIGVAAAYGVALALRKGVSAENACAALAATRPTAINLRWALSQMQGVRSAADAFAIADALAEADVATCRRIGEHGAELLASRARELGRSAAAPLQILTHCNAGFLATVDWGTALAAIYVAKERGLAMHVWVSETRPRLQGMLTAWELQAAVVPHTIVADNMGGHLLQRGHVDLCIVGSDRTTATGDVCNKIGTYMKAACAREAGIPFYVALPRSTIDFTLRDGAAIPIEERGEDEVHVVGGVRVSPTGSRALNLGFDVTPAHLVTALITEAGVCAPRELTRADEGVIKFTSEHVREPLSADALTALPALLVARDLLRRLGVLGQDPARYEGAGFGNVSVRLARGFLVSGTQTSGVHSPRADDFCVIEEADAAHNRVRSRGPCRPSSESLTHAMFYAADANIGAVLHGHCAEIWRHALALGVLTTPENIAYGTVDMANAVRVLHASGALGASGVLCMLGHEDGVVTYAPSPAAAAKLFYETLAAALAV
jgi:methylthioribose-1-phosphate isomerase